MNSRTTIEALQVEMAKLPQVELTTDHYFADGMYARVVSRPAGTLIVGKVHKREHFYIVAKGRVQIETSIYEAGTVIVSQPGTKRAVYALEDSICLTVHRTAKKNLRKIEKDLIEPDETALFDAQNKLIEDRADYQRLLQDTGFTHKQRRAISENEVDQIPMPPGFKVSVCASDIQGQGLFALDDFPTHYIICPARIGAKRTPAGRFTNHSVNPNAAMRSNGQNIDLVALRPIRKLEEITVNYRQAKNEGAKL